MNRKLIICLFLLISVVGLFAHPHMQILDRTAVEFENGKVIGFTTEWEFDAFFSADIIMSYDLNEDGVFDSSENIEVFNNAFISLKDFNYFVYIRVGDDRFSPTEVERFKVEIAENGNLIYKFFVPLESFESRDFYISVYDFTYFCACFYQETTPVSFVNDKDISPSFSIEKNEDYPVYYDPFAGPEETVVHNEWKKGLNEIIVQEIHIVY